MRRRLMLDELAARIVPTVFYVAPGGNNNNAGSSVAPWATLQFASDQVAAGDQVIVRAGNYVGFHVTTDGTPSQPIVFTAEANVAITSPNPSSPQANQDGINIEGADYITIEGFRINDMPRAGIRVVTNTGAVIRNNSADHNGRWAIFTGFAENVTIENNTTSRSQLEHGIYVSNSADNPIVRGNTSFNNRACGIHMNSDASMGGDGVITGALIENNTIYGNGVGGGSAINMDGVSNSIVRNNLLYDNHATGIGLYQIDGAHGAQNNLIVNNTVRVASDGRWALLINNASMGNTVFNNVLLNDGTYRGSISVSQDSLSGLKSDYNVVMDRFTTDDGNTRLTLTQWRAAGHDTHSIIATPIQLFEDLYRLLPTSPAIDAGIGTFNGANAPALALDGFGRPSGSGYDIGAFERNQGPAPRPNANADAYAIGHDRLLTVAAAGVLANDASDPVGRTLTAALVSGPSHGTLTLNANGSFSYRPAAGFVGSDSFTYTARDGGLSSDPATVTLNVLASPKVKSVVLNDDSSQRSLVRSMTITFDTVVTIDTGAFALVRNGGGTPTLTRVVTTVNGETVVTLTFKGSGIAYGSLNDGNWALRIYRGRIHLAADRPTIMSADHVFKFHRYFGDSDGDRDVDVMDRASFDGAFGRTDAASLATFDYDNDGDVDVADLTQFNRRLGRKI
jgi:parallel beta-helix repeat protein